MILYNKLKVMFPEDYDKLLSSKKQFIALDLSEELTSITSSKVGGMGYLPLSTPYPINKDGKPLSLLAQINFSEMPELSEFPKSGLLSFYIDCFDDGLGHDIENPTSTNGFRVLYFENLTEDAYDKIKVNSLFEPFKDETLYPAVKKETKLVGKLDESIPFDDIVEFTRVVGKNYYDFMEDKTDEPVKDELLNAQYDDSSIGGFPHFVLDEPRKYDKDWEEKFDTLLLQLDSNEVLCWGDCAIGNFFINKDNLKSLDFSEIFYSWDSI